MHNDLVLKMRQNFFSIMPDDTTDIDVAEQAAFAVRICDVNRECSKTYFYGGQECPKPTAENIFLALETLITADSIPWENLVGLTSDGCNVMRGKKNSVMTRVLQRQTNAFCLHCPCHAVHLCAVAAAKTLPDDLEQLLRDVVYHFE